MKAVTQCSRRRLGYVLGLCAMAACVVTATVSWPNGDHEKGKTAHMRKPLPTPEEIAKLPPDGGPAFNRLIHEKSPYLLQHARNPVDWYPWGDEAFARAKAEDKPIFLSVGYSTCHWCHVMEHESFESDELAALLNEHFVAIKVDREERPDIDDIYMTATQLVTGQGGWPNSVWLTHEAKPWYAGTYFPPEDRFGRPGFKTVLLHLTETWRTRREDVELQAERLANAIQQMSSGAQVQASGELTRDVVKTALTELRGAFDERLGGFGGPPKFPPHGSLRLLLYEHQRTHDDGVLRMATRTLDAMALGGIRDHIGGGFHRYSTDARWFLPHFEKMLYDNAQLSRAYVDAYLATDDEEYRRVAVETYDWVLREMTAPEGGFYSALDADSEGEEGKFYLWSPHEIGEIVGASDGDLFCRVYNVKKGGNFRDEASGRMPGTSIAFLNRPLADTATAEGLDPGEMRARLDAARAKLLQRRTKRIWPHLDDKVLTSWNGLMIGSLAYGGRRLDRPDYVAAAERVADFILSTMRANGRLLHSYREGVAKGAAYLDDYAFLADGLLDLHEATGERRWLKEAEGLVEVLLGHYVEKAGDRHLFRQEAIADAESQKGAEIGVSPRFSGFFFTADDHEDMLLRLRDPYDKAIPSGNGVAARVLVRLGLITGETQYTELARSAFDAFLGFMQRAPRAAESLVLATAMYFDEAGDSHHEAGSAGSGDSHHKAGDSHHFPDARARTKPVTVEAFAAQLKVAPGESVRVAIRLAVDDGWHVNSHTPTQEYLIPTSASLKDSAAASLGDVTYPPGTALRLGFSKTPLSVYEGEAWIEAPIRISKRAKPGATPVTIEVRLQPCNDRSCLRPETLALSLSLEVDPRAADGELRHEAIFKGLQRSAATAGS